MSVLERIPGWKERIMEEYDLSEEHVDFIVNHAVNWIPDTIENPTMPEIQIKGFGTFRPNLKVIKSALSQSLRHKKIGANEQLFEDKVRKLWPIRNRLINEANGEYTQTNWAKHFKESEGEVFIVYKEDLERFWIDDFPGFKKYGNTLRKEKPEYAENIKPN